MIEGLKPYPKYKDSGVPWIGQIPFHWDAKPLDHLLQERHELNAEGAITEVLSVLRQRGVIPYAEKGNVGNKKSEDITRYKIVRPNDIVVNCMNVIIGSVGMSRYTGCLSPVYYVLKTRSENDSAHYLNAYFQTEPFQLSLVRIGNGILAHRMRIPMELLKREYFPRPPTTEQLAIVRFLDHAERKIRRYIAAKRKLIKLLEEEKQAIIHRAVTRGLDPNVRLKPSGVEWLGDIPEGWNVVRLRNLTTGITSGSRGWSNYAADAGPLFIRIANLSRASIDLRFKDVVRLNLPADVAGETKRTQVKFDDILLSITAYIGSVGLVPDGLGEAYVSQHVACCRLREGSANPKWVAYFLLSPAGQTHGVLCMYGGTKQGLSLSDVKNYVVLLPSRDEQDQIVELIEAACANIDKSLRGIAAEIELINEYRARLISEVVTGKLDVREAAAALPDEPDATLQDVEEDALFDDEADDAEPEDEAA